MDISELSEQVSQDLSKVISADLSLEERGAILKIVQKGLLEASGTTHETYKDVASICCGPDTDLAHKIQEQMDKKMDMLVANLSGMR